jgi:hypothetical protein
MKGFMRQRGDAWELRVYLGSDPVTGKQRYATRTVRGGKRVAQRVLAEMVTDADRGPSVRTNATVGELIEAWFEHAARDSHRRRSRRRAVSSNAICCRWSEVCRCRS